MISSGKDTNDIEIGKAISYSTKCLVPKLVCWSLILVCYFPNPSDSSDTNREKKKTNERHTNINHEANDDQYESDTNLRYNLEKKIVSSLPDCFCSSVDNFLFFPMLNSEMILRWEEEHFFHWLDEKIIPISMLILEEYHSKEISRSNSSNCDDKPYCNNKDNGLRNKSNRTLEFLFKSIHKYLIKIGFTRYCSYIEDHESSYLPFLTPYFMKVRKNRFQYMDFAFLWFNFIHFYNIIV